MTFLTTLALITALAFPGMPQEINEPEAPQRPAVSQWIPDPQVTLGGPVGLPNSPTQGFTISNKQLAGPWAVVIGNYKPTMDMVVKDSIIEGQWYLNNAGKFGNWTKWGIRLYDVDNFFCTDTIFRNIGNEHGAYMNVIGDVTFQKCHFFNIGSQGLQFVFRTTETTNPAWKSNPGTIKVAYSVFQQCTGPATPGWPAARASFTISSHPRDPGNKHPGQILSVQNVFMEADFGPFLYSGKSANSFGAVMCEWHDELRMNRVWIDYVRPFTRPVIQAHNLNKFTLKNSYVREGRIDIVGTPVVEIKNCTGNAEIWDKLEGVAQKVGMVSTGYTKGLGGGDPTGGPGEIDPDPDPSRGGTEPPTPPGEIDPVGTGTQQGDTDGGRTVTEVD